MTKATSRSALKQRPEKAPPAATSDFSDSWFEGCDFTTDWSSRAFKDWSAHLGHRRGEPLNILEIGSWEGRGSLFFLNFFPRSTLTALDIFTLGNEGRFDRNVMAKYADRTTKVKGTSATELDRLGAEGATFDLIYLDGSHLRDDVMVDSILAWRLLKVGGHLIWDDYELIKAMPGHFNHADQDPKPAIDEFLGWHGNELKIVHRDYQVIAEKTAPHYHEAVPLPPRSDSISNEAARTIRDLRQRIAEAEAELAAGRQRLQTTEQQLTNAREEYRQNLIELGRSQKENEALKDKLHEAKAELISSEASTKRTLTKLRDDLRSAEGRHETAEASLRSAEAALARRYEELALFANLLREAQDAKESVLDHASWLASVQQRIATQPRWWNLLPRAWSQQRQMARLQRDGLFDADEYLARNPDVAAAGLDPIYHYAAHGFAEGRIR